MVLADSIWYNIWYNINNFDYSRAFIRLLIPRSRPAYTTPITAISWPSSSSLGLLLSRSSTSGSTNPKTKRAYYKHSKQSNFIGQKNYIIFIDIF
jgi:hypothetical protein